MPAVPPRRFAIPAARHLAGWSALALMAALVPAQLLAAEPRPAARPAVQAKPSTRKAAPIKPRRRVRPAAGASSARPVPVPDASEAATARAYRKDAARHLYSLNLGSIYRGRMPPLLYAIGVLQVQIDGQGRVGTINWMRAPRHAPEVMRAIERMVRAAEPFPPPKLIGGLTYTDTWLWHKSGKWQLDTLTEGQD